MGTASAASAPDVEPIDLWIEPLEQWVKDAPPIAGDPLPIVGLVAEHAELGAGLSALNATLLLPRSFDGDKACLYARSQNAKLLVRGEVSFPHDRAGRLLRVSTRVNNDVRAFVESLLASDLSLRAVLGSCSALLPRGTLPTLVPVDPSAKAGSPPSGLRLLLSLASSANVQWRYAMPAGKPTAWQACMPGALHGNGAFNVVCRLPLPPAERVRLDIARPRDYQDPEITSVQLLLGGR